MNAVLTTIIGVSVVTGLGLVMALCCRRQTAALRHWIIATALCCAAILPLLQWALPSWSLPIPPSIGAPVPGVDVTVVMELAVPPQPAPRPPVRVDRVLVAVWAIAAMAGVMVVLAGLVRLRRVARDAEPVDDDRWRRVASAAGRAHRLTRPVALLFSAHPVGVVTWGLRRPKVLLPPTARDWGEDRIRVVLFHELAHIARGDWAVQILASLLCCVYWFNPLLWIAHRRLRHESERACDDAVMQTGVSGTEYATHLVAVAQEAGRLRHAWSAGAAIAHSSTLEERIHAMLTIGLNRQPLTNVARCLTALALLLATLLVGGTGTSAATMQPGAASISGVFYDQHSGVLPDVEVTLTQHATRATESMKTDATGAVSFRDLAAGDYTMVSRLAGFAPVSSVIRLGPADHIQRNILMPIGSLRETVTVATPEGNAAVQTEPAVRPAREIPEPRIASPCVGKIGGCIKAPRKLFDVKPIYPQSQAATGAQAQVALLGRIGIDGFMNDVRLADPNAPAPHRDFVNAAIDAVRQWEFSPTLLNGVPVEANMAITVQFVAR